MRNFHTQQKSTHISMRILSLLLAVLMLLGAVSVTVFSLDNDTADNNYDTESPEGDSVSGQVLPCDYDTLIITRGGTETYSLELLPYEKIEIKAEGVEGNAEYQWQIYHSEADTWVNIYGATTDSVSITLALVENMLASDGTAQLRCRSYTETYAYLTTPITVTLVEEEAPAISGLSIQQYTTPTVYADEDTSSEFANVTIEYIRYDFQRDENGKLVLDTNGDPILDSDGTQAFRSYVATLHKGGQLHTTVANPTLVGYDAFFETDGKEEKCTNVTINLDNIQSDVTYRVKYKPADVNYVVRYYFQNIYDDLYVEDTSMKIEATGATGSTPKDDILKKDVPGFTSLYYQPDSIAADGSTVFKVYYERNYYLMEFDCNEGYGTDTVYVRYESYISVPNPIRHGWYFDGWDLVSIESNNIHEDKTVDSLPATMPAHNSGYKAIWSTTDTTYTVVYWLDTGNSKYSYIGSKEILAKSNDKVAGDNDLTSDTYICGVPEHSHDGTDCSLVLTCELKEHTHTDACYECELDEHTHSNECTFDTTYLEFVTADGYGDKEDIIIEGDGSTVVNVYYTYKSYTLRYYYAKKDSSNNYYIVGGSTYGFGALHSNTTENTSIQTLLENVTAWGKVKNIPTVNKEYKDRYKYDTVTYGNYTYYYLEFTATYSSDLTDLWPIGIFDPVEINETHTQCDNEHASFSAWNGEFRVKYTQDHKSLYNGNETIKGCYTQLDKNVIFSSNFKDVSYEYETGKSSSLVSFLGFWENGANINWSIPELYRYRIWVPVLETEKGSIVWFDSENGELLVPNDDPLPIKIQDSVTYKLIRVFDTCDDSDVNNQTPPAMVGYDYIKMTSSLITDYDTDVYDEAYNVDFYYSRQENRLRYYNYTDFVDINKETDGVEESVPFGTDLTSYMEKATELLEYPDKLEPGAYEFAGWYTTAGCYENSEFGTFIYDEGRYIGSTYENVSMPAYDLTLYAKWTPVIRKVTFYSAYSDIQKDKDDIISDKIYYFMYADDVPHGTTLGNAYSHTPEFPTDLDININGGELAKIYIFVGWFYMDENGKKRFAPDSMEITRDLVLFAEWQTSLDTTYEIQYVLAENVNANTANTSQDYSKGDTVADRLYAHSSVGKTKTFNAKGTADLYTDFKTGFFPIISSHSILMDTNGELNTFTFEYVYDPIVYYKVRYVDYVTRTELEPSVVKKTEKAIVTEKFLPIEGYIPQNFYITKSLASDGENSETDEVIEENIITFYYTQDKLHGLFSIEYYLEYENSPDSTKAENYYLYESTVGSADINNIIYGTEDLTNDKSKIRQYDGYTFKPALNTVIIYNEDGTEIKPYRTGEDAGNPPYGTVDYTGLTIRLYYARNQYPYIIEYREYGAAATASALKTKADGSSSYMAKFDSKVSHTAEESFTIGDITYEYYIADPTVEDLTKSMTIREVEEGKENPNKLVFYYTQKQYPVEYHVVCTVEDLDHLNALSLYYETAPTAPTLAGSTAMAGKGFQFIGWYSDAACTTKVSESWVTKTADGYKLQPGAFKANPIDPNGTNHYYAKFEPIYSRMTISKTVKDGETQIDPNRKFLFHIKGQDTNNVHVDLIVTIEGTGSVDINNVPIGNYTVTELTDWSWDYPIAETDSAKTITVEENKIAKVEFVNAETNANWLSGETSKDNLFNPDENSN